jgi:transposase
MNMKITPLLTDQKVLAVERIVVSDILIVLIVKTRQPTAQCPRCHYPSRRVHSHYTRTVADLPWQGVAVQLMLRTRRFFCPYRGCPQRIFCERLPSIVAPHGRRTLHLHEVLRLIGFMLGGEAGARLASRLGMRISPDTLLRRVRQYRFPTPPSPRVLGIDDWAFRKGRHYGTILVDLERRQPVDLLPDREAMTLVAWLQAHPGVEIISRDRAPAYAEAAHAGAPHAVQVADRWHLLKNLQEAVQRFMTRQQTRIAQATTKVIEQQLLAPANTLGPVSMLSSRDAKDVQESRERRYARYCQVRELHRQGVSQDGIAEALGVHHATVRTYIRAEVFPERAPYRLSSQLDPYVPYLHQRWVEGCKNPTQLWREIVAQGYRGTPRMIRRYVTRLRQRLQALTPDQQTQWVQAAPLFSKPSVRRVTSWLLQPLQGLSSEQEVFLTHLCEVSVDVKAVRDLVHTFQKMVRERQGEVLPTWLESAEQSPVPEMRRFAAGIRQDYAAVAAALEYEWSNGQVEGQINRLKLIKRQMYGRAKLDVLKARLLYAA